MDNRLKITIEITHRWNALRHEDYFLGKNAGWDSCLLHIAAVKAGGAAFRGCSGLRGRIERSLEQLERRIAQGDERLLELVSELFIDHACETLSDRHSLEIRVYVADVLASRKNDE